MALERGETYRNETFQSPVGSVCVAFLGHQHQAMRHHQCNQTIMIYHPEEARCPYFPNMIYSEVEEQLGYGTVTSLVIDKDDDNCP